jgi:hypothetical protein
VPLKELVLCLNRSLLGQFLMEICPFKKMAPFLCRIYAALAGVLLIARHGANIRAKSANGQKETIQIIEHLCSEAGYFGEFEYPPASKINSILKNKACCSVLINRIPVMTPILAPILGVHFFGGIFPSKIGRFDAPF